MLVGRDIIVFGDDWGRYPSTIQHIGKVLAHRNRLLWIGSLGLRKPELSIYDLKRVWEKGMRILRRSAEPFSEIHSLQQVHEIHPFVIPFHDNGLMYRLNMSMMRTSILSAMERLKFRDPILLTSSPIIPDLIGTLGETSSHYFCLDDFTLFEGAFDTLGEKEQRLVAKVDSCFSISEGLMKTRQPRSGNNYFLPQGVNTKHFAPSETEVAEQVKNFRSPVIGFFGLITSWVDIDLIVQSALRYPQFEFVILGKTVIDISIFSTVSNIHYLGEIPFAKLPMYARIFDVGIIPFVVNNLTLACNPLKLLEYLSLGIPVVSTNMPEVKKLEPAVIVAESREDFIDKIQTAVDQVSVEGNVQRREFAERYSWESITKIITDNIVKIENEKLKLG
jgi:glycosyltransferase involved in cell wall biosynthesis